MNYIKAFGLVAVVALAAMAFTATASATEVTSPAGTTYTGNIQVEATAAIRFHTGHLAYECFTANAEGDIDQQGSTVTAKGDIDGWIFGECGSATVDVLKEGTVELHTEKGESNGNGIITVSGSEVTGEGGGFHCVYSTNNTPIGTLTGSKTTKGKAVLDVSGAVPRTGGKSGIFCGSSSYVTGLYTVTSPSYLDVD